MANRPILFLLEDRGYLFPKYSAASMRLNCDQPVSEDIEEIDARGHRARGDMERRRATTGGNFSMT